ncbi:MAG TPA: apolipoprotein N-acyltransferase, partial [Polyangiaceae bacterium]|nr:apolipoprotein N-acyltransferase [Polyangiaceae bacterium]
IAALASAAIADAARLGWRAARRARDARRGEGRALAMGVPLVLVAFAGGSLLARDAADAASRAKTLSVGIVQPASRGSAGRLEGLLAASDDLGARGAEIVVWSEGAFPGVLPDADADALVEDAARERAQGASILAGAITRDDAGRLRNVAVLVGRDGDAGGRYEKRALLPFAERLPLEGALPILRSLSPRSGRFVPGARLAPLAARGVAVEASICYEDLLTRAPGERGARGPSILVNLTNDAWFDGSSASEAHAAMARLRAIESGRALVRATENGTSVVYGADGGALAALPSGAPGTLLVRVPVLDGETFYARFGSLPAWLLVAALGVTAATWRTRRAALVSPSAPS